MLHKIQLDRLQKGTKENISSLLCTHVQVLQILLDDMCFLCERPAGSEVFTMHLYNIDAKIFRCTIEFEDYELSLI